MKIQVEETDVTVAMATAVRIAEDERISTPNEFNEGLFTLKTVAQEILRGTLVCVPKPQAQDAQVIPLGEADSEVGDDMG